jgi:hypothetical protein
MAGELAEDGFGVPVNQPRVHVRVAIDDWCLSAARAGFP